MTLGRTQPTKRRRVAFLVFTIVLASVIQVGAEGRSASTGPDEHVIPSTMCGPYFVIPIEVDGPEEGSRVELLALFDTGGAQLSIEPQAVERIWGRQVGHGEPVKLENAAAGSLSFGTMRPRALSMTHLSRVIGIRVDLFLPFRAFRSVLLTLDFPRDEIRIASGRLPKPDGVEVFNARGADKRPYLEIAIGGRERRLLADSGSSGSISIRESGPLDWKVEPLLTQVAQGMDSLRFKKVGRLEEDVDIAGVRVSSPIVSLTEGTELIGTDVMERFQWTFDQRSRRMRIRASSKETLHIEGVRGTGAVAKPADTGYEIVRVLSGTPADDAGLLVGDLILAIDGTNPYEQGCERWEKAGSREQVTLKIEREQRTLEITVPVTVLVP